MGAIEEKKIESFARWRREKIFLLYVIIKEKMYWNYA